MRLETFLYINVQSHVKETRAPWHNNREKACTLSCTRQAYCTYHITLVLGLCSKRSKDFWIWALTSIIFSLIALASFCRSRTCKSAINTNNYILQTQITYAKNTTHPYESNSGWITACATYHKAVSGVQGMQTHPKILIYQKSGQNLWNFGYRCETDCRIPSEFDFFFQKRNTKTFLEVTRKKLVIGMWHFCDGNIAAHIFFGKVWGNSGKNPSQPKNLPAPTPTPQGNHHSWQTPLNC